MLKIDPVVFSKNLLQTQKYCHHQMNTTYSDIATVFRSFNPLINNRSIFEFKVECYDFYIEPDINYVNLAQWTMDPSDHFRLIDSLFLNQMAHKEKNSEHIPEHSNFQGDIVISSIDESLLDGASAVQSLGLFDDYDMPPIDTWFYLTKKHDKRLLFAWIPAEYRDYANEAIAVNCLDCIGWFSEWYPDEYKRYYI